MASWDLEEGGWLCLLPQWQSLEEEMGVVLCKRPHRAYIFSRLLFPYPSPTAWLVWLDEPAAKHLFFLLVIKQGFCRSWDFPSSSSWLSRGIGGKRDRGVCVPPGRKAHWSSPIYSEHEWKMRGPIGSLLFKDIRRLLHGMIDEGLNVDFFILRRLNLFSQC